MVKRKRTKAALEVARLVERELVALAREGRLARSHGVEATVAELLALLARGGKAPLLAGEPGVGKTALVHELARAIAAGTAPPALEGSRIVEVSLAGIFARASNAKQATEHYEALLAHLAAVPGTIVYLRDAGLLARSSLTPAMIAALRAGKLRFVLEVHAALSQDLLRSDEALAERFHLVVVPEPGAERARWILGRVAEQIEEELGLHVDPASCDMSLRLASRFLPAQRLPRKALELLRDTAAEAVANGRERCGPEDVIGRFCGVTRLPRFVVDDQIPLDVEETGRFFSERLLGQNDAVAAVLRSVALLKAGLNDPRRPLGVFLFAGPTGVGKTHLAKLLAEYLFGAADRLVRLNMADYPDDGDEYAIFGSPWAPTPEGRRGELARLLNGKVFTVLLLDEFEKAHGDCHDRFLQLFDEGRFVTAAGEVVPCNNTFVVATSNVGAEVYREPPLGFAGTRSSGELVAEVDRRIAGRFRPEFLNRFDAVCHFLPLGRVEIRRIAHREVGRVFEREGIRARGLDVEVAPEVVDLLVERGHSPAHGARFLQREIEKTLTAALAVEIARRPLPTGTRVRVEARPGGRVVAVAEPKAPPREDAAVELPAGGAATSRRRLDRKGLVSEAERLVQHAAALAAAAGRPLLEEQRASLLATSQAPGFWEDPARAAETLRAFRSLDARLQDLDRLARICGFARRRSTEARGEAQLAGAARAVEEAAREIQLAKARAVAGGEADEAIVELRAAGEGDGHAGWIAELAAVYLGWADRRGYEAVVVAEGAPPPRAILRLSGPGVLGYLAGEEGLHRRIEEGQRLGAYVCVHRPNVAVPAHLRIEGRDVRRRRGRLVERVGAEASAWDDATGREIALEGGLPRAELEELAGLLLAGHLHHGEEARRYHVGRGARVEDPRTGAATPRIKDVLRGELDLFLAAWLSRPPGDAPPPAS